MRNKEVTKKEGITLIALVITIIILLILAGITITAITGENGLLNSTLKAKEETEIENEKEIIGRATAQTIGEDDRGNIQKETLQENLDNETSKGKTEVKEKNEKFEVIFTDSIRHYLVDKDGNVRKEEWWSEKDEEENNYITNGNITLQTGDYILYDANDNGEYTYTSTAERTGIASGENQTFSSNYETKWRLLGVENTESGDYLMLVPEKEIKSITQQRLGLVGAEGYVYGIEEIENISKIYGNGKGALYARAMKVEDVNKITGYDPLNTGDGTIYQQGKALEYLNEITITRTEYAKHEFNCSNGAEVNYSYSSVCYFNENNEYKRIEQGKSITLTCTYYRYYATTLTNNSTGDKKGISENSREYSMLFSSDTSYWTASKYVLGGKDSGGNAAIGDFNTETNYSFFRIGNGVVGASPSSYCIAVGGNKMKNNAGGIKPIVYLNKDIQLRESGNQVNSCTEWKIEI